MKRTQKGMGFLGLVATLVVIAFVTLIVLKLVPVYIDYFTVKKAVATVANGNHSSSFEARQAFDRAAVIDRIDVITGRELNISGNPMTISFAYEKRVHLFANVSLYFEFAGQSTSPGRKF